MKQMELELDSAYIKRLEKRIKELEFQVKDNHERAEEIILSRENQIDRMNSEIQELEAPKTCGNCKWFISSCGSMVCSNAEFEPLTTADNICFMGYKPKESE